jgi:hypothetical protein
MAHPVQAKHTSNYMAQNPFSQAQAVKKFPAQAA